MFRTSVLFATVFVVAPFQSAVAANTPSVAATLAGSYAIGEGFIPEDQWEHIAVTRNDGPLHAEASGNGGRFFTTCTDPCVYLPGLTSASVRGFASADPGVLRIYGSVLSISKGGENGQNLPRDENSNSVYSNLGVSASFTDYLTVTSPNLAAGTPVQVPVNYLAEVEGGIGLTYRSPMIVYASFNITGAGPQNFSTNSSLPFFRPTPLLNGNTRYTVRSDGFSVDAHVGDVLTIGASFGISGDARINRLVNGYEELGDFADGRNTAGIWLGNLPSGIVITSASGHDYRLDPSAAAVPEPASVAMMLAGLGLVGFAARRRAA